MTETTVSENVGVLAEQLASPMPMRRGSVSERHMKCNKPGCPCGDRDDARHGPYYSVSRVVKGKTKSVWLNKNQVEVARRQVEAGQKFRERVDKYWEACEAWADAEIEGLKVTSDTDVAQKGGSKIPSTRKSSEKSKP